MQDTPFINEMTPVQSQFLKQAMQADWPDYFALLNQLSANYQLNNCLKLLNAVDELLNQQANQAELDAAQRLLIGGAEGQTKTNRLSFNPQLLGDMSGLASYKKLLKQDTEGFARLMRMIPAHGPIDGWHFMQFSDGFQQWFVDNGLKQSQVFPATRLLTMKRPDQFVPLSAESNELFCGNLGIKALKKQDFQRYWDEIIVPIQQTQWFKSSLPMNPAELPFYRARVALLDRLVCTPLSDDELAKEASQTPVPTPPLKSSVKSDTETASQDKVESLNLMPRERVAKEKAPVKQPKKLTIAPKKSAKVNQNAATKLMSQFYFANKEKFARFNMAKHRDTIINRIIDGESVEAIFEDILDVS